MKRKAIGGFIFLMTLLPAGFVAGHPQAELWDRWEPHNPNSTRTIDHSDWDEFIDRYLIRDHPSGVARISYGDVSEQDHQTLASYVDGLQQVPVGDLNRDEQLAFWLNLYNALTIRVILDHYPVETIRDIDISGAFRNGPWDAHLVEVEDTPVTLNDIEHRVIRPIWQDPRIHYVINCASIGCPDLYAEALTAANVEQAMAEGAETYINHPRGVSVSGNRMTLSSIYDWFQADFGGSEESVIDHLLDYADRGLAGRIRDFDGRINYEYDWSLNAP